MKRGAVDAINTKCAKAGGIKGVRQWAAVAESADLPIVIGTEWGAGLKVAAKLHLGAAVKNADPVVELTEIMIHELLLKEPLSPRGGLPRRAAGRGARARARRGQDRGLQDSGPGSIEGRRGGREARLFR